MFNTALYLYPTRHPVQVGSEVTQTRPGPDKFYSDRTGRGHLRSGWVVLGWVRSKCSTLHCTWTRPAGSTLRPHPDQKKIDCDQDTAQTRKVFQITRPVRVWLGPNVQHCIVPGSDALGLTSTRPGPEKIDCDSDPCPEPENFVQTQNGPGRVQMFNTDVIDRLNCQIE